MTPQEYNIKMQNKLQQLRQGKILYPVATEVHNRMTTRIFDDGRMGDGSRIGSYSTTPAYYEKDVFKKTGAFHPQGKITTGTKTFKAGTNYRKSKELVLKKGNPVPKLKHFKTAITASGKTRKTMFLPLGYKELRQIQGMQSDKVNVTYSGLLRSDFASHLAQEGNSVVARLSNVMNQKKVAWLTAKYGPSLFKHSEDEKKFFVSEVTKKLVEYFNA